MRVFAIDDEPKALRGLVKAIAEAAPGAEISEFSLGADALSAIKDDGLKPDVVFSDITMPGINGLELAVQLKKSVPGAKIVFVTGYSEFALNAYRLHVNGYIMKPVEAGRIKEELDNLASDVPALSGRLRVQCFGRFEVYYNGEPLKFGRRQTKELFAFLIDKECALCTAEEICSALWENETDLKTAKTRLRQLISDLRKTVSSIGMSDLLIRSSGLIGLRRDMTDCDYYRMLEGNMDAVNSYRGEYMSQYVWAEITAGRLYFHGANGNGD